MAIIKCPECGNEVSDEAFKCPKCGKELKKAKRGIFGKLCIWGFWGWNVLMVIWVWTGCSHSVESINSATSSAEQAGAAIGSTLGLGVVLVLWVLGDIILGLAALFTKPKH